MYFTNQQNIRKSEFHFPYQQQHASETAKDVETCKGMHFYRTQLMAVHNTVDENKMQAFLHPPLPSSESMGPKPLQIYQLLTLSSPELAALFICWVISA